jgi:hypothetical protein
MGAFMMPANDPCKVIYAGRDPTEKDIDAGWTLWISTEYLPHKVFQGHNGHWIFIGKFTPEVK